MTIKDVLLEELDKLSESYAVCGIVDQSGCVYPLGADTKVLSTIFELVSRPAVYAAARTLGYEVVEPTVQNHYPDFTFHRGLNEGGKIAIDVKTTYRLKDGDKFSYTLGGYTSFIRNERKNIVFPFSHYSEHWVIGFVYNRIAEKKAGAEHRYDMGQIADIPLCPVPEAQKADRGAVWLGQNGRRHGPDRLSRNRTGSFPLRVDDDR